MHRTVTMPHYPLQRMAPLLAATATFLLLLSVAGVEAATTYKGRFNSLPKIPDGDNINTRASYLRSSAKKRSLKTRMQFFYADATLGGCRSNKSGNEQIQLWIKQNGDRGYLFRDLASCCKSRFAEEVESCMDVSKAANDETAGGKQKKGTTGSQIIVQQRKLGKSSKSTKSGKQGKYYKPWQPSWQRPQPKPKQPSWQKPKQPQQKQPQPKQPMPQQKQPQKQGWNQGQGWNNWNSWHGAQGWNSWNNQWRGDSKSSKSKSSKSKSGKKGYYYPPPRPRTKDPTPLPTPRPTPKPTPVPVDPPTPPPVSGKSLEIRMGGLLTVENLDVPPPGSQEMLTLAHVFEQTILRVLDEGYECDVTSIGGVPVGSDGEYSTRGVINIFNSRHNRSLQSSSVAGVVFNLRVVEPCPDCTDTDATLLAAKVFDETFEELAESAESGELTVIFCALAQVANIVATPCQVRITGVEYTSLAYEYIMDTPPPVTPEIPPGEVTPMPTLKPTMRPVMLTKMPVTAKPISVVTQPPTAKPISTMTPPPTAKPIVMVPTPPTNSPSSSPTVLVGCPPLYGTTDTPGDYAPGELVSHPFDPPKGNILGVYECVSENMNYLHCPRTGYAPGTLGAEVAWIYKGSCNSALDYEAPTDPPVPVPDLTKSPTTPNPTMQPVSSAPTESPVMPEPDWPPTPSPVTPPTTLPPVTIETKSPTASPNMENITATILPTASPNMQPVTPNPTLRPATMAPVQAGEPGDSPTESPFWPTFFPTNPPTPEGGAPTTAGPTMKLTMSPNNMDIEETNGPTASPSTEDPTSMPSMMVSHVPSNMPTSAVSNVPSSSSSTAGTTEPTPGSSTDSTTSSSPSPPSSLAGSVEPTSKSPTVSTTSLPTSSHAPTSASSTGTYVPSSIIPTSSHAPSSASSSGVTSSPTSSHAPSSASSTGDTTDPTNESLPGTTSPTVQSVPTSMAPTSMPPGAIYYSGFEKGTFTEGYPRWANTGGEPWAITSERVKEGMYSIRSPDLTNPELTSGSSNVTFTTDPSWPEGTLVLSVLPGVTMPVDNLVFYVDGETRGQYSDATEFQTQSIALSAGEHEVMFSYMYNPLPLPILPPPEIFPDRLGAVFIDEVYYLPAGQTMAPNVAQLPVEPTISPKPSTSPTQALVPSTYAPTSIPPGIPPGAEYYKGFERGSFPDGDPEWTTEGDGLWELNTERANSGLYSIRSPVLKNPELTPGSSNVTLVTNPNWPAGTLAFSVLAGVEMPFDDFVYFVDGNMINQVTMGPDFAVQTIQLSPGPHTITFSYRYNPSSMNFLPPDDPDRIGAVFIDDVYFLPEGVTMNPTTSLTPPPVDGTTTASPTLSTAPTVGEPTAVSPVPTLGGETNGTLAPSIPSIEPSGPEGSLYFDGFEDATFPDGDPEWTTEGDGLWELSTERAKSGTYSIRSPNLITEDRISQSSNVTMVTNPNWPAGSIFLSLYPGISMPYDSLVYFVDDMLRGQYQSPGTDFETVRIPLSPGPHTITFSYRYNPIGIPGPNLPPEQPDRIGAAFIDDVFFLPEGVTIAPSPSSPAPQITSVPGPTIVPVGEPTSDQPTLVPAPTTIAPTSIPQGAQYFDGFEKGTFPDLDPQWTTVGDAPWELTSESVNSGVFSIRSPDFFTSDDLTAKESNVTLQTNPAWPAGSLVFSINAGVELPYDDVFWYVDGNEMGKADQMTDFGTRSMQLSPGPHAVTFVYKYNPLKLVQWPPRPSDHAGVVFIDDVYFLPEGQTIAPTTASSGPPIAGIPEPPTDDPDSKWFPFQNDAGERYCEYGATTLPENFQFETKEECCEAFPEACHPTPPPVGGAASLAPSGEELEGDTFFDGFETGDFSALNWEFSGEENVWMVDTSNPYEGTYSAHARTEDISESGNFAQLDLSMSMSSAAFMQFYFYAPVSMPFESFELWVDGNFLTGLATEDETWSQAGAILPTGEHVVSWRLANNPEGVPQELLDGIDQPEFRVGEAWLDNVQLLPATESFEENWESGDFSANPWILSGDGDWSITDSVQYEGAYSATIAFEDIEEGSGAGDLSIEIITEQGGTLEFQILPSVSPPFEIGNVLLDDLAVLTFSNPEAEWSAQEIEIQPGKRRVTFRLFKNPAGADEAGLLLVPNIPGREGAIWLDGIVFTAEESRR